MTQSLVRAPLFATVRVIDVERLSPSFVRITLGGAALEAFGIDGKRYDQRIKVVLPRPGEHLVEGEEPFDSWLAAPESGRGPMRTYTLRNVLGAGLDTRLILDIVIHDDSGPHPSGPGARWAVSARPGDLVRVLVPRAGTPFGGIEFDPTSVTNLLLVGDETAAPAVASILADLPQQARGAAILEVPEAGDIIGLSAPSGVEVSWLPRGFAEPGSRLLPELRGYLGVDRVGAEQLLLAEEDVDTELWETPTWSASGESLLARPGSPEWTDFYAWIAGEARWVTSLRRLLVNDLDVPRDRVAFMGYWRRGVAMRG